MQPTELASAAIGLRARVRDVQIAPGDLVEPEPDMDVGNVGSAWNESRPTLQVLILPPWSRQHLNYPLTANR